MAVTAILVYELRGATGAQHTALREALAMLPTFKPTHLHNTWEIESRHAPNLHSLVENAFRGLLEIFKVEKADFRIYTAPKLDAGAMRPSGPAAPRLR